MRPHWPCGQQHGNSATAAGRSPSAGRCWSWMLRLSEWKLPLDHFRGATTERVQRALPVRERAAGRALAAAACRPRRRTIESLVGQLVGELRRVFRLLGDWAVHPCLPSVGSERARLTRSSLHWRTARGTSPTLAGAGDPSALSPLANPVQPPTTRWHGKKPMLKSQPCCA